MRIVAGRWKGHPLRAPPGREVRPTPERVREAWMAALAPVLRGARALDLFAGSGALGLEALSRGAAEVVFVERSRRALRALRANVARLGADKQVRIVEGDALRYLRGLERFAFELALADPPYAGEGADLVVERFRESPFARELWIEHRAGHTPGAVEAGRVRRYGDTALSTFFAGAPDEPNTAKE